MPDIRINALATTAAAPALDDFIELDGTTNGTRKLSLAAYIGPIAFTRSPSSFLYSDGATAGRGAIYQGSDRTLLTSVPAFEFVADVLFPATTASENRGIITVGSTGVNTTTGGFAFVSFGSTLFFNVGTTGGQWQASSYAANNAGKRKRFHVIIPCGTQNAPTVTDETGATVTFTQSVAPSGSDTWLGSTLANRAYVVGAGWPAGETPSVVPVLGTLTSTERDAWLTTGRPPAWVALGGSAVAFYTSNFTASADTWSGGTNTLTGNTDGVAGEDDWLKVERTTAGAGSLSISRDSTLNSLVSIGSQSLIRARIYNPVGSGITHFYATLSTQTTVASPVAVAEGTTVNCVFPVSIRAEATYCPFRISPCNAAGAFRSDLAQGTIYYIKTITVSPLGALSLPSVQSINVVDDLTAIGGNQARLLGNTPILLDSVPVSVIERPAEAYTTTSIQLLGGAISGARKRRIVSVTGNSSASVNLSLGTSTGGTQLINAQAVNGNFDISTFASRFVAANLPLWLTFSGSTTASIQIHLTDL